MLINKLGNILIGKTSHGKIVKITNLTDKTIVELNGTIREKSIREIPLNNEKEIFKKAFPQYNDFKMILRSDKYKGNRSNIDYYGYLAGKTKDGSNAVLIRQSKNNTIFSDIIINYDSSKNLPRNPSIFEGITVETFLSSNHKKYTKITNPFARAYLRGEDKLKSTETATNEFYKIMRKETDNKRS